MEPESREPSDSPDGASRSGLNQDTPVMVRHQETSLQAPMAAALPFTVSGQVLWDDGRPAAGVAMQAVDQDLRGQEVLGQATTDGDGRYTIAYVATQFARAEKASADLVVHVLNAAGAPIAT